MADLEWHFIARDHASAALRRVRDAGEAAANQLAILRRAAHPDDHDTTDTEG